MNAEIIQIESDTFVIQLSEPWSKQSQTVELESGVILDSQPVRGECSKLEIPLETIYKILPSGTPVGVAQLICDAEQFGLHLEISQAMAIISSLTAIHYLEDNSSDSAATPFVVRNF